MKPYGHHEKPKGRAALVVCRCSICRSWDTRKKAARQKTKARLRKRVQELRAAG